MTTEPEQDRTPAMCNFAADAIEALVHMVDDREASEMCARIADAWRAEAAALSSGRVSARAVGAGIDTGTVRFANSVLSTDVEKLRTLADWLDLQDDKRGYSGPRDVQADLRRIASEGIDTQPEQCVVCKAEATRDSDEYGLPVCDCGACLLLADEWEDHHGIHSVQRLQAARKADHV